MAEKDFEEAMKLYKELRDAGMRKEQAAVEVFERLAFGC